jgi:hypothetical protein
VVQLVVVVMVFPAPLRPPVLILANVQFLPRGGGRARVETAVASVDGLDHDYAVYGKVFDGRVPPAGRYVASRVEERLGRGGWAEWEEEYV